jgi:hypothetical protein
MEGKNRRHASAFTVRVSIRSLAPQRTSGRCDRERSDTNANSSIQRKRKRLCGQPWTGYSGPRSAAYGPTGDVPCFMSRQTPSSVGSANGSGGSLSRSRTPTAVLLVCSSSKHTIIVGPSSTDSNILTKRADGGQPTSRTRYLTATDSFRNCVNQKLAAGTTPGGYVAFRPSDEATRRVAAVRRTSQKSSFKANWIWRGG